MEDWLLLTIVFGGILIANLVSLLCVYRFQPEVIPTKPGSKVFFIFWMCLVGVLYWITEGIGKIIQTVKSK